MSYITSKLNGIIRSRQLLYHVIGRHSQFSVLVTRQLHVNLNNNLLRVELKNQNFNQFENYSTKERKSVNYEGRFPKILAKLSSNKVSLQFDKFTNIRPSLFRNYDITVANGFNIMKSCSQLVDRSADERIELVQGAWNEISSMLRKPTKDHLILLLQAYRRAGLKSFDDYRAFFEKYNCPIDADIYAELMYIICQNDESMEKAEALLGEMTAQNVAKTTKLYNALILGYSKQGIEAVENIFKMMKQDNILPSSNTYTELIKAYVHNENTKKAIELLEKHDDFNTDHLCDIIRCGALNRNEEIIEKLLSMLPEAIRNAKQIAPSLQNICIELVHLNSNRSPDVKYDPYQLIIRHLPVPVFGKENQTEYATFLMKEMIVANESASNILEFCEKLIESQRNLYAIHSCCMYSLIFNSSYARVFLEALAKKESLRPHYFLPLLKRANDQNEVVDIIKFAKSLDVTFDTTMLQNEILPRMNTLVISQETVKALTEVGVRMLELKTALIAFLLNYNRPKEALDMACRSTSSVDSSIILPALTRFIKGPIYSKNSYTVATIIKKLQSPKQIKSDGCDLAGQVAIAICNKQDKGDDVKLTKKLIGDYEKNEVKISQNSADYLLRKFSSLRSVHNKLSPIINKLVDKELFPDVAIEGSKMSKIESEIESLENQLREFEANKFPTHGILFQILKKTVQIEQWNRAMEIKKKCDQVGVIETPAMLSILLRMWTATKNTQKAQEVMEKLQKKYPGFKIDAFKIVDYAKLLITEDRFEDAVKLLENLAPNEFKNTEWISSNIWHLLNAASEYAVKKNIDKSLSEPLLHLLVVKGYCVYSNAQLGVVIKEYLDKKQIREAVRVFEQFVEKHRKTPQTLTLLTTLIELSNRDSLEEYSVSKDETIGYIQHIIDLSKEIHGAENTNVQVILAFASSGNENQLRKIFMNPSIQFNPLQLLKSVDYLRGMSKIGPLVTIARSARGLQHSCLEEDKLYDLLLSEFVRSNDFTSAIQLYEQMQRDDNSLISNKFCNRLAEFLKKNNQPLPVGLRSKGH